MAGAVATGHGKICKSHKPPTCPNNQCIPPSDTALLVISVITLHVTSSPMISLLSLEGAPRLRDEARAKFLKTVSVGVV